MRKWLPLITVCLGTFVLLLDVTIVNVALPDMAADLRTSFGSLQWVVDAYTVTLAALVLGTGSIADLAGHRRTYLAGLTLFAASSLACGLAPGAGLLVAARIVQGAGAAAMFATAFALLNSNYSGRDRGTAYGMWGAVSGAASAVGPILGGVLTDGASWRWVFFVNLPVTVLAVVLCLSVLRETDRPQHPGRVDVVGMASFTAAAGTLVYGLIHAAEHGWHTPAAWLTLAAAPVLLAVFVVVETRSRQPMLDLTLLNNRTLVGVLIGGLLLTFSAFGAYPYTSIWLQSVLDLTAIQAGLTAVPLSVAAFAVATRVGRRLHNTRPGPIIGGGLLLVGAGGIITAALLQAAAGWPALIPGSVVTGLGVGLATPTLGATAAAAVPIQRSGTGAGALNTMRQLGLALSIAVLGGVFSARATHLLAARQVPQPDQLGRQLSGGQAHHILGTIPPSARAALDANLHTAAINGLQWTFLACGLAGLVSGISVLTLLRPTRNSVITTRVEATNEPRIAGRPVPEASR